MFSLISGLHNADALSRNPVDLPTEEAINDQFPQLKIMVLQPHTDFKAPKGKKEEKPRTPNSSLLKPGPSGTQAPSTYGNNGRGRPLGATTRKIAPPLDHSVIAHITRQRNTGTKKKVIPPKTRTKSETKFSSKQGVQSTPFKATKNKSIDVSLGPQFNQSSLMMSSTVVEESEEVTNQPPPIYDPRRSGLRVDDLPPEEDKTEKSDTAVAEDDDRTISNAEIEFTGPAVTDSEVEEPTPVLNTTLIQDEVFDSAQKFEESLRILMEKTQNEGEESYVVLPKHFSEGDDVDDLTRSVLDEMDPYDPATTKTDVLAQKVKDLIESTAAAAQTNAEQTSKATEEGTSEATNTDIPTAESSTIQNPPFRAISLTPQIQTGPPAAKSTPLQSNTRAAPQFPNLDRIPEEAEGSQSVRLNFTEPPSDVLALVMSHLSQYMPFNQYVDPEVHRESLHPTRR